MMLHVIHTFSTVQQDCLTLKMEATGSFEASGNASHPTRTEQSATQHRQPEISQQYGLLTELSNSFVAVVLLPMFQLYSHNVTV